ncbi:MAG: ABC transporter ATP-binding protein [Clostridiales bacterium]|nr:ABC transporter ATP-binding protein [Clostridiales bacterium]
MIVAEHLNKLYGGGDAACAVLKDVSLQIEEGELAVILGASGSGKSTLLSVLSGLERPTDGKVIIGGEEITAMSEAQLTDFRKRTVGFVFQQYFLLPHLTVEGNVRLCADLVKNKDYGEVIRAVGLWEKRKRHPKELSGGEQQRVSIARALAKKPKILFMDEPTGALDEETGRSVLGVLVQAQRELGFTAVMVTHNPSIAEMADKVITMNSGEITSVRTNENKKSADEIGW